MTPAARRWLELAVRSPEAGERESLLAEGLVTLGGRAVEERDGWYVTHLEDPSDLERFLASARDVLRAATGAAQVEVRTAWIAHEDWAESWKRGLAPRRVTSRIVVRPSWETFEPAVGDLVLVVDPGMAFGTAEHGTTRGCLRLLDGTVHPGDRVLDVGAGSGILSIAAAGLGAGDVLALEGDPLAVEALAENVTANGAAGRVRWETVWADVERLASLGPRDGVVANIESGVLKPLLPGFASALVPGGWLILSGILAEEWEGMCTAAGEAGFSFRRVDEDGEWRSGLFLRDET